MRHMAGLDHRHRMAGIAATVGFLAFLLAAGQTVWASSNGVSMIHARNLELYDGQVKVLPVQTVSRVAVGNGKIIGVTTLKNEVILIGRGIGTTDLDIWGRNGTFTPYHILITPYDNSQTYEELQALLGRVPGLVLHMTDGQVVLTGSLNPENAREVARISKAFPGVVNMTRASSVDMKRMVYLDVQVIDFKKNALRNLGIQWQNSMAGPSYGVVGDFISNPVFRLGDVSQGGQAGNALNGLVSGQPGPLTGLPVQVNPFQNYLGIVSTLTSQINLAVQDGSAYILANPQLSTRSGGVASFLAGGEIPIPISSALGQTTVLYKKYGVMLKIKPMADRHGNILANINTEVSQLDPTVTIDGYPGFLTRKTQTVVNVHSGQTIVLSGLIHSLGSQTMTKFPWLGDIPILGWLFKSNDFQASRSELVIFVTPVIFNPASPLNHRVIHRGVHYIHKFDATMGRGLYMPGFGVGPGSRLGLPVARRQTSVRKRSKAVPASRVQKIKPTAAPAGSADHPSGGSGAGASAETSPDAGPVTTGSDHH